MTRPKIFGIAGWKNSGKTGLAVRLVTELVARGYKVGVISDSFDHLGGELAGIGSGDLPLVQVVLDSNLAGDSDEGRAMCEIVYDVAPGADIAFPKVTEQ